VVLIERERIIAEKETQLAERDRVIAVRDAELYAKTLQIEHLKAQLAVLRRARFGRSSEKLDREIEQLELVLGELEESVAESNARTEQRSVRARHVPSRRIASLAAASRCPRTCRASRWSINRLRHACVAAARYCARSPTISPKCSNTSRRASR
jgi:chromosome segregation ATPase